MPDQRLFRLRVTYRKAGRLAQLSHLEVTRALERAVRRSGLPFAITNGFSPHMRIAFGAALPVGVGGDEEIYDIFLTDYLNPDKALAALQASSASDMMPLSCKYIEPNAAAASVALPVSTYVAVFDRAVGELQVPKVITVQRKKKEKELVVADFLVEGPHVSGNEVRFSLAAKDTGSLRSDVFMAECLRATYGDGSDSAPQLISVTRVSQNC